jgi:hypothetical protein
MQNMANSARQHKRQHRNRGEKSGDSPDAARISARSASQVDHGMRLRAMGHLCSRGELRWISIHRSAFRAKAGRIARWHRNAIAQSAIRDTFDK